MPARSRSAAEALRLALADDTVRQLVRFVIAGVGVTLFSAAIYLVAATALHVPPLAANTISHAAGIVAGYLVHSRWSFRADRQDDAATALRFTIGSGFAFLLNSAWVWLAVGVAHLPVWTPVTAMLAITPLASFALNRRWVFAES